MKIISWQSLLTDHQYFTWLEMQKLGHEIQYILGKHIDEEREKQGWNRVNLQNLNVFFLSNKKWWKEGKSILLENADAVHIFGGFWADRRFFPLILFALHHNIRIAIMNESYSEDNSGYLSEEQRFISSIKVLLRPFLYRIAIKLINAISKQNRPCLLPIGSKAMYQFSRAGFKKEQIFPFGYFVPRQQEICSVQPNNETPLKLIFIGSLIQRKGLDIAVRSVDKINCKSMKTQILLDVYGYGNPENWISDSVRGISYKGMIPFGSTQTIISRYDYLILPSRHDGWGVVVNEALLQGIPVIVSDQVGAKCLIENSLAGRIFPSNNQDALVCLLDELKTKSNIFKKHKENAEMLSNKILPGPAAEYLQDVLNYYYYRSGQYPKVIWS